MEKNAAPSFNWHSAIDETFNEASQHFLNYVPQILGALVLLLLGYGVAHIASALSRKVARGLDSIFCKLSHPNKPKGTHITPAYTVGISRIVFWCIMLFFVASSANLLGWKMFAGWMDGIVSHLPSILTGILIILIGFVISNIVLSFVLNADLKTNRAQTALVARIAQIVILVSAIFIGVEHIGLDMHFLTGMITIIVAILLGGACLAFGLGARNMVANTIGAQYARRNFRLGECVKLAGYEGELIEIRQTCIVVEDTKEGRVLIPAKLFNEKISVIRLVPENFDTSAQSEPEARKADS